MMFRNHCNQSMLILAILRSFQFYSNAVHELYEGLLFDLLAFVNRARKAVAQISHVRIIISGPTEMNVSAEMEDV